MPEMLPSPELGFSMQMVQELAAKIQEPAAILDRYGLSEADFQLIAATPQFRQAYKEAKAFWESDANTKDRIVRKAQVLVEDALVELYTIFKDRDVHPATRIQAIDRIHNLAKVDGGEQRVPLNPNAGATIVVNIDMGANQVIHQQYEHPAIEGEVVDDTPIPGVEDDLADID